MKIQCHSHQLQLKPLSSSVVCACFICMALKISDDSHHGCSRVFHVLAASVGTLPEEVSGKGILTGRRWMAHDSAERMFPAGGPTLWRCFLSLLHPDGGKPASIIQGIFWVFRSLCVNRSCIHLFFTNQGKLRLSRIWSLSAQKKSELTNLPAKRKKQVR